MLRKFVTHGIIAIVLIGFKNKAHRRLLIFKKCVKIRLCENKDLQEMRLLLKKFDVLHQYSRKKHWNQKHILI